jgi:hypothetical protein
MPESWHLKLDRAEHHLKDLDAEIARYVDSKPYDVVRVPKCRKHADCWRYVLRIRPIDPVCALILGDAVHNMRSALDHLAVALSGHGDASFPIVADDIDHPTTQRELNARARFNRSVQGMPAKAVAAIRDYQPFHEPTKITRRTQGLAVIGYIDNADKHRTLALVSPGLAHANSITTARGQVLYQTGSYPAEAFIENGADVAHWGWAAADQPPLEESEVHMQTNGTPTVTMHVGLDEGEPELGYLPPCLSWLRNDVVPSLEPHIRH